MYIVTQLKKHCSDAHQLLYYCESLEEACSIAQDIANETADTTHILEPVSTIYPDKQSVYYVA